MGFFNNVHEIVRLIPEGRVMSYVDIAEVLGDPKKARFVGWAMKFCPNDYPWQRVVRKDGRVVTGDLQAMILRKENVPFVDVGYVNMEECRFFPVEMLALLADNPLFPHETAVSEISRDEAASSDDSDPVNEESEGE